MINSQLILDIIDLILDDENEGKFLREQIDFITEKEIENTGIGMFINFDNKFEKLEMSFNKDLTLVGVEIRNEKQNVLADAILYVKNGLIAELEIFNKNGQDYPIENLDNYILEQTWIGSKKLIISH